MKQNYLCPVYTVTTAMNKPAPHSFSQQPSAPPKNSYNSQEKMQFSCHDIDKVIQHIVQKGNRFSQLTKTLTLDQQNKLQSAIHCSPFVKVMIRRTVAKMGDERRLGNQLKGFSRLLLEEIQKEAWQIILLQLSLIEKQAEQKNQKETIMQLLSQGKYINL